MRQLRIILIDNSLHLARKYARIFFRGHNLIREANSFNISFNISRSELATLIINKVTKRGEVYQCKLTTDLNVWNDKIRDIVTGEHSNVS